MFNSEYLQEKWAPLLNYEGLEIKDSHRRAVTAVLLENQEKFLREEQSFSQSGSFLSEAPANVVGNGGYTSAGGQTVAGFDPVLISLIRRAMPNLVAYDLAGVQPMSGPTGLIFAMRSRYETQNGREALFNEPDTGFSGQNEGFDLTNGNTGTSVGMGTTSQAGSNPGLLNPTGSVTEADYSVGQCMRTDDAEDLGTIHGLNAEAELANILSSEILAEINREVIRTIYKTAEQGATLNTATAGVFDLDVDSNGRWSVEKFKGLLFQIERDANQIAQRTRRGKGNVIMCSADVASALSMAGVLDYTPALNANLNVDDTGNTFAGVLMGKWRVYIDPYAANNAAQQYYVVGYKGSSPYDAGLFYCPYVPLQMVRAVGEDTFQPKIGFKTRYGMVANPFAQGTTVGAGALTTNSNRYYRRVQVKNLM